MTTIQSLTSASTVITTLPGSQPSSWQQLLADWERIETLENTVKSELTKSPPDWATIKAQLEQMETLSKDMSGIAKKYHLNPPSDPNFAKNLSELTTEIQQLIGEIPNLTQNDFAPLDNQMCIIFQDILQGSSIKNY